MARNLLHQDEYPCPLCSAHFASKEEQVEHLTHDHGITTPWICHECPVSYADEENLAAHIRAVHPTVLAYGGYVCHDPNCGPPFASELMLVRHRKHDHFEQAGFTERKCIRPGCEYQNESYVGISLHVLHFHAPTCDACGAVFLKADDLLSHIRGKGEVGGCPIEPLKDTNSEPTSSSQPLDYWISNSTKVDESLGTDESYDPGGMSAASWSRYLNVSPELADTTLNFGSTSTPTEDLPERHTDFGTPVTTPLRGAAGHLLQSPIVSPLPSTPNYVAATSAPSGQFFHGLEYQPRQEFDTPQSIPAWISPQWANPHPVPTDCGDQQPCTPPDPALPQRFEAIHSSTPVHSHSSMLAGPLVYPQHGHLIEREDMQQMQDWHTSAFSPSSDQLFGPQLPSQSFTGTIDPRLLHEPLSETLNLDPTSPIPIQTTETEVPNTLTASLATQSVTLPASISEYGFKPQDFDPQTVYKTSLASKDKFKPFPPDLQEELILNADPKQICYGNLLRIATKYSNSEIVRKVNEGRPMPVLKSVQVMESRIRSALSWKADQEKPEGGLDAVKDWFEAERAKHGLSYRRKKPGKEHCRSSNPDPISPPRRPIKIAPRAPLPTPERSLEDGLEGVSYREHTIDTAPRFDLPPGPHPPVKVPAANHHGYQYPSPYTDATDTDNE